MGGRAGARTQRIRHGGVNTDRQRLSAGRDGRVTRPSDRASRALHLDPLRSHALRSCQIVTRATRDIRSLGRLKFSSPVAQPARCGSPAAPVAHPRFTGCLAGRSAAAAGERCGRLRCASPAAQRVFRLRANEVKRPRLFAGKALSVSCQSRPLFTDQHRPVVSQHRRCAARCRNARPWTRHCNGHDGWRRVQMCEAANRCSAQSMPVILVHGQR